MVRLITFMVVFLLSGCGYQLKQPYQLHPALKNTHLALSLTSPLYQPLATALTNQGIQLVNSEEAEALLVIGQNRLVKEVQSIGVNNRVQEYRLDYQLDFKVYIDDQLALESRRLQIGKDYAFDIGQITGTQSEERLLREQLYQDMAQMIIRYLANQNIQATDTETNP
ncbi:MAG: LPS assembly lipoprotein LptE [Proteobacteria bacterium]|nr:LPS assembly lipoprotein LptE [Pseudomonadota bacterium]